MNQIMNMVMRIFLRKVISKGMDKGFDMAANRSRKGGAQSAHGVSDADRAEMAAMKQNQKRTRQAAKIAKRMGRF